MILAKTDFLSAGKGSALLAFSETNKLLIMYFDKRR